jgi:protocatechuate 3,4-dioxygenase beta subunit
MMRPLTFLLAVVVSAVVIAQDDELVPAPYLADRYTAPANAPSTGVLASGAEPGERLVVTGRVLSGARPVAGASLFVFQTDSKGEYAPGVKGNDAELNPRLHALLRTDAQGGYRFESVRPGSYNGNAAHVHYIVKAEAYKARLVDLWFQDDPILVARRAAGEPEVTEAIRNTPYYRASAEVVAIRPVSRDSNGVWHATRDIQMFAK